MRVLVTGPLNPFGRAIVAELANAGHTVRAFGVPVGTDPFHNPKVECFPGAVQVNGSIEPVASECQAIVHAAPMDESDGDRKQHALHLERGALYARYAADRELVDLLVGVLPASPDRAWSVVMPRVEANLNATRGPVPHVIVRAQDPKTAAREVVVALAKVTTTA